VNGCDYCLSAHSYLGLNLAKISPEEFLAAYPEINVRLLLADRNLHLIEDHVDMAVRIGSLPDSSMIATRVGSMRTVVCASPKLLARHGVPESPEDVARLPCVNFEFLSQTSSWPFG
jgi:DNA-binding transcriptional LysR family regulator